MLRRHIVVAQVKLRRLDHWSQVLMAVLKGRFEVHEGLRLFGVVVIVVCLLFELYNLDFMRWLDYRGFVRGD